MKRIFFLSLAAACFFLSACDRGGAPRVCIGKHCFGVEVADTPLSRQQGLMYRDHLPEREGMLFVFPAPGRHGFWMKNTFLPLDIIWIDSKLNIVDIAADVEPCRSDRCPLLTPRTDASYVLEVNGGLSLRYGISVGDRVRMSLEKAGR